MPRPMRKCLPCVTYHCYSRCIELRNLLAPDYVKNMAVEVINRSLEKYNFELIQIEFVENHFHFIIKTTKQGESISRIMQFIKARIAEKYNRMMGRTGSFWNERFKSRIIEESENPAYYFLWLTWYIAYNPVRKKVIRDPRDSKFGTIRIYLEEDYKPIVSITLHDYFKNLGNTFNERLKKILEYEDIYRQHLAGIQL